MTENVHNYVHEAVVLISNIQNNQREVYFIP